MNNSENAEKCLKWIAEREKEIECQDSIDEAYSELQQIIQSEMNTFYKPLTGLKKSRKAAKLKMKEWWCEILVGMNYV